MVHVEQEPHSGTEGGTFVTDGTSRVSPEHVVDVEPGAAASVDVVAPGVDGSTVAVSVDVQSRLERVLLHQVDVPLVQQRVLDLRRTQT